MHATTDLTRHRETQSAATNMGSLIADESGADGQTEGGPSVAEENAFDEELAWSDSARVTVAVHISALLLASTFVAVDDAWRPWIFALLFAYASVTAATQRSRRSLAPCWQAMLASLGSTGFALLGREGRRRVWAGTAVALYASEALLWRAQTADLIALAFSRFQRMLFASIVVATVWGMPLLYDAADRLEKDATAVALDPHFVELTPEAFFRQFAATILYGGTAFLLSVSAAVWFRLYRVAPDLFRLLVVVTVVGATVGLSLHLLLRNVLHKPEGEEEASLTGASAASFATMAYCVLYDRQAAQATAILAVFLYVASRLLRRPNFAALCVCVQIAVKFFFAYQLHQLGSRRPRNIPRLDGWPTAAALFFPATTL